ncbi:hypothetical protein WBJ53_21990 [Spirosoma sp. SC4-14]|uniref:hypothetical protein n=1 Tax=Spirosoma sp. SC4-14 TaxID=3128900 RepID=UPI0030D0AFA3
MQLNQIKATIKSGQEQLTYNNKPLDCSLLDFWRWSVSDILSNATRGRFAEFIVATATNIDKTTVRDEWAAYDLETSDGIKLEIKSAAYVQSWFQRAFSKISFSTKAALHWDSLTNKQSSEKKRYADIYVFCLLYHKNKLTVDPLNMNHWEFYIMATKELNEYTRSQHSITLKSLQRLTNSVPYGKLYETIKAKHKLNGE